MKYFFTIWICSMLLNVHAEQHNGINAQLLEKFSQVFPQARNIVWAEEISDYIVHFNIADVRYVIFFEKNGNLIESTRYYSKENLPSKIAWILKRAYPDYEIFGVTEVSDNTQTEYFIKLESSTHWKTIRSDQFGNLNLIELLDK